MMGSLRDGVGWSSLGQYVRALEANGELLRVSHPVDLRFEAGCIADRLVKRGGPAVVFDQPRLADGSISKFPLAMNLFGTRDRINMALGVNEPSEIGEMMVKLMKPDIGELIKKPWKGLRMLRQGLSMTPKKVAPILDGTEQ